jgi:mono/diheme cytochrome c family protein
MKRIAATLGLSVLLATGVAAADNTARTFNAKCAACHGEDGKGKTKQGEKMKIGDMTNPAWQKEVTDDKAKQAILEGITRTKDGVAQEMKPMKDKLSAEQVDALVKYVRAFKP